MANREESAINSALKVVGYHPGSEALVSLLQAGYPNMTEAKAKAIIKTRQDNPMAYSLKEEDAAVAFLAALTTRPIAIDTEEAWRRED